MYLTKAQEWAVNEIINKYKDGVFSINFKAPTGSGKTFIISNVISRILREEKLQNNKAIVICATLSTGGLPKQLENDFIKYQDSLDSIVGEKFTSFYQESPSKSEKKNSDANAEIKINDSDVLIFGKQSFGKDRLFYLEGTFDKFINYLKINDYSIIYIRDEAHIGSKVREDDGTIYFENVMQNSKIVKFIIKMTATPNYDDNLIEIPNDQIINPIDQKFLIKNSFEPILLEDDQKEDFDCFKYAINIFKNNIIPQYRSDQDLKYIRPCVLIQVDNETASNKTIWAETLKNVEDYLKIELPAYAVYFGNDKRGNLKESFDEMSLSKNDSAYDCIIFKTALAIGWNIPRACMLIQLRNLSSESLSIQTIGRIRRNPVLNLKYNEIAQKYWIYSKVEETQRKIIKYSINEKFKGKDIFPKVLLKPLIEKKKKLNAQFQKNVKKYLTSVQDEIVKKYIEIFLKNSEIRINISNEKYYSINDCFKLELFVQKLINNNQKYFDEIKDILIECNLIINRNIKGNKLDQKNFDNKQIIFAVFNKTNKTNCLNFVQYMYIIFNNDSHFLNKIINDYNKFYQFDQKSLTFSELSYQKLPDFYYQILDEKLNKTVSIRFPKSFLYLPNDSTKKYIVTGNNLPEEIFFEKMFDIITEYKDNENPRNIIDVWGKNPYQNNNQVSFDYIDDNYNIASSFPDALIKIKDKFLIVEIKSTNDINKNKTECIQASWDAYFPNEKSHGINNDNLFFAIAKIDVKSRNIFFDKIFCLDNKFKFEMKDKQLETIIDAISKL